MYVMFWLENVKTVAIKLIGEMIVKVNVMRVVYKEIVILKQANVSAMKLMLEIHVYVN